MSYYQKFITALTDQKWVLLLAITFFALPGMTAVKVNFSGEWKLNESKKQSLKPVRHFEGALKNLYYHTIASD